MSNLDPQSDFSHVLRQRHLPALDGLRACSVFIVMFYHFGLSTVPGDLGVSAFFVLSGFLITWLLLKERDRTGTISLRDFYMRRVLRIFPAYYVFLAVSLGYDQLRGDPRVHSLVLPGVFYLMNYYNALLGHPSTSIAHAWSLAIEEQFYLLWPALFLVIARRPRRQAAVLVASLVVAFAGWRSFLYLGGHASQAYVYNAFDTRADILAIGCLLAFVSRLPAMHSGAQLLARSALLPFVTLGLLLFSRMAGTDSYHYSIGFTIDGLLVAVLIVQMLLLSQHPAWRWLNYRAVRYLGAISYPLYLYHNWASGLAAHITDSTIPRVLVAVAAAVLLASMSYYLVERPFVRLKSKFEPTARRATSWAPDATNTAGRS